MVDFGSNAEMLKQFETGYRRRYSFLMPDRALVIEAVSVEAIGSSQLPVEVASVSKRRGPAIPADTVDMHTGGTVHRTPVFQRAELQARDTIRGPAILAEVNATTVVEPGWQAEVTQLGNLVLKRIEAQPSRVAVGTSVDPVMLEVFNNLIYVDRRADGPAAGKYGVFGEHQRAAGFFLRVVRCGWSIDRQCAASSRSSRLDG
jgi:5-oxoprolinase (ATP-hydrolysing)